MSARSTAITRRLREIIHEFSGYPIEDLPEASTFLELGFDSLFLTQLATAFQNEFKTRITFRQLFDELPSIGALTAHIDAHAAPELFASSAPIESVPSAPSAPTLRLLQEGVDIPWEQLAALSAHQPTGAKSASRAAVVREVLQQQLELMSRQLALLTGATLPSPSAVVASTPAVEAPGAETPQSSRVDLPAGFGPNVKSERSGRIGPRQRAHLDALIERYTVKTKTSKEMTQRYRRWHADPRTAAGFNQLWKEMVYPIWVAKSKGSRLWDLDGNEYIDILNGFGPNFFGHSAPFVIEALHQQLDRGIEVGPQTPLAGETAELFCKLTGMDRVSFVNTGSEAVQAAIRLSRTVTGRDRIAVFRKDYHGNFDEVLIRGVSVRGEPLCTPLAPGIPRRAVQDVVALEYGADEALDWIRAHGSELAAVLVEPVQSRKPELQPREFLHELRKITEASGTVLVFDEVITGFRTGPGGAQAMYGVEADLATYGKVFGGGMPVGAVAGRTRFMDTFDGGQWSYGDDSFPGVGVTFFAGTFVRHPLAIAAANAVLKYLSAQGPALWDGVNGRTTRLTSALNRMFERHGVSIEVPHCCSQMFIRVNEPSELATLLFYHLRDRGVHVLEGFPSYMTLAHSDGDVDELISRFTSSVEEMTAAGIFAGGEEAPAPLPQESFALTPGQRDVWMASQLGPEASCAFNESDTIELIGEIDVESLRSAARRVVARHQAFQLRFAEDGSSQTVKKSDVEIESVDLVGVPAENRGDRMRAILRTTGETPFDLERGPLVRLLLIRLEPEHHLFVIYSHHIVFDGWSADVVMREIAQAYSEFSVGREPMLGPVTPFSEYAAADRAFHASPDGEAAMAYWRNVFAESPARLDLPTDRSRSAVRTFSGGTAHATLDAALSVAVRETAKRLGVSTHSLLFSAFQVLLSRLSGQEDFVIGVPAAGQAATGLENVVGYCVNLMPVRCACILGTPFDVLAKRTRDAVLDAFEHQRADLAALTRSLPIDRAPNRLPLVEVVFNHSGYLRALGFAGLEARAHENERVAVLHDSFFNVVESDDGLVIDWDFNRDLFDEATIRQWIRHLEVILAAVVEAPSTPIEELPLLTREEQAQLAGWSRTRGRAR